MSAQINSALYIGHIGHRRFGPRRNAFRYRIFLMFIDLQELPNLFTSRWLWSARRPALAWFRRADFLGDPGIPLDEAVRIRVAKTTGIRTEGPIRLLTHLRYFGHNFNPVNFYFVYDASGKLVENIVTEITNTPWDERHTYVLSVSTADREGAAIFRWQFEKKFHVSPFYPMDMHYDWRFTEPSENLNVHMESWRENILQFDATLTLKRTPISAANLARILICYPLITLQVTLLIYWQALRLILKRTPFFTHPDKLPNPTKALEK